jgi:hypothetical protein
MCLLVCLHPQEDRQRQADYQTDQDGVATQADMFVPLPHQGQVDLRVVLDCGLQPQAGRLLEVPPVPDAGQHLPEPTGRVQQGLHAVNVQAEGMEGEDEEPAPPVQLDRTDELSCVLQPGRDDRAALSACCLQDASRQGLADSMHLAVCVYDFCLLGLWLFEPVCLQRLASQLQILSSHLSSHLSATGMRTASDCPQGCLRSCLRPDYGQPGHLSARLSGDLSAVCGPGV